MIDPKRLQELEAENAVLRQEIARLKANLAFHEQHPTFSRGIQGETLIASLLDGSLTAYAKDHDIVLPGSNGARIEVKFSRLNRPSDRARTLRWVWNKPFGESGQKSYDFLVLVGDADTRFSTHYKDSESPKIVFVVPYAEVLALTTKSGRSPSITVISNPLKAKSTAARLFHDYQVTMGELQQRFLGQEP